MPAPGVYYFVVRNGCLLASETGRENPIVIYGHGFDPVSAHFKVHGEGIDFHDFKALVVTDAEFHGSFVAQICKGENLPASVSLKVWVSNGHGQRSQDTDVVALHDAAASPSDGEFDEDGPESVGRRPQDRRRVVTNPCTVTFSMPPSDQIVYGTDATPQDNNIRIEGENFQSTDTFTCSSLVANLSAPKVTSNDGYTIMGKFKAGSGYGSGDMTVTVTNCNTAVRHGVSTRAAQTQLSSEEEILVVEVEDGR